MTAIFRNVVKDYLKALRPEQWTKNLVAFAGLIFAREFTNLPLVGRSAIAFVLFCLASSAAYLINDVVDYEKDRLHPEKRVRPIAAGRVPRSGAVVLALILIALACTGGWLWLNRSFLLCLGAFVLLNVGYSLLLKHQVILDVMAIAAGFVLRAVGGALAIEVTISAWLVLCTTLLALFLGFGKRRHELVLLEDSAPGHRANLADYSTQLLDQLIAIVTAATITAYGFYTLSPEVKVKLGVSHLELTIPFVIYGLFRYLYLIHKHARGGSPTRVLYTDLPILVCVVLWIVAVLVLMYLS